VVVITGANQGGKTTFLRSVGLAQLMMQAGMFAPAQSFRADVCDGIFTHFRREEDEEHERGKFEEELARLSAIVDELTPHSLLLLNESFATTNEREGSEIAGQVVAALVQHGVKVFYVTHFHELADRLAREHKDALFLRAERTPDGRRTFQLVEGKPLPTSFGEDLFRSIFQRS
jgi:DNA mismatch repair ATPase MutS